MHHSQMMIIMHELLNPVRKKMHKQLIKNAMNDAFNQMPSILPSATVIWLIILFGTHWQKYFASGVLIIPLLAMLWPLLAVVRAFIRRPCWQAAAKYIDDATNPHNIVAVAYEHSKTDSPSLFAKFSVYQGVQILESFSSRSDKPKIKDIMVSRIAAGIIIAGTLYAGAFWLLKSAPLNIQNTAAMTKTDFQTPQLNGDTNKALPPPRKNEQNTKNKIPKPAFSQALQNSYQKSLPPAETSGMKSFGNDNTGQQSGKSSLTQSGSAASAMNTGKQNKMPDTAQKQRKDNKSASSDENKSQENSSNTASKGMAGSSPNAESDIKASLVSGGLGETPDNDEADENQQERPQNSLATLGQRPELSDKQTAPNRDLGMTGKPGDKPGDGRGGPGLVKKSRATASALSAMTIPVYIKGQIQPGKSKSYSQSLPLTAGQFTQPEFSADESKAQENQTTLYTPDEKWKSIINAYFLNFRKSETQ